MREQLALLPEYLTAHVQLTLLALLFSTIISLPLGIAATRTSWLERLILGMAGVIQTIPSLALLAIMVPLLAGLELDSNSSASFPAELAPAVRADARTRATAFAQQHGIPGVDPATLGAWRSDEDRTLYVLDVRTAQEYEASRVAGAVHAPGGQLVQATDQWIAVRGARVVLTDDCGLRATISAHWLRAMGHDAYVFSDAASFKTPEPTTVESR